MLNEGSETSTNYVVVFQYCCCISLFFNQTWTNGSEYATQLLVLTKVTGVNVGR